MFHVFFFVCGDKSIGRQGGLTPLGDFVFWTIQGRYINSIHLILLQDVVMTTKD